MRRNTKFNRKLSSQMKRKLAGLFVVVVLALVALSIRITVINATSGEKYSRQVLSQSQQRYDSRTIPFQRGDILDRNGTKLAYSEKVYNVILDCKVVNTKAAYREPTIQAMTSILGIDEGAITSLLDGEDTKTSPYQIIEKGIDIKKKQAFETYIDLEAEANKQLDEEEAKNRENVRGVWFEENYQRKYPLNDLACKVIGFSYSNNLADWGIEGYYSNTLNGVNGRQYGYFNEDSEIEQTIIDAVPGDNVSSTIDVEIQKIVENKLKTFCDGISGVEGGSGGKDIGIVLENPQTGEILAMASTGSFDLNNPRDLSAFYTQDEIDAMSDAQQTDALSEIWQNFCITDSYEPGSVVKPINMAAALECGTLIGNETFYCDGSQTVGGVVIKCASTSGHGQETLSDIIKNSCNDGMMQIAAKMGADNFIKYQNDFYFGVKTGIDLPGEGTGVLHAREALNSVELATASFGQGYTCTMIQEIAAISCAVNGGYYYSPHVVGQVTDRGGSVIKTYEPVLQKQVISNDTSAMIRDYMEASCLEGTSRCAKVSGYSMGGKTGTSQKIPRGNGKYLVSYIGFAPKENPQLVVYVVIDEPNFDNQQDSRLPQYISKQIMQDVLPYLGVQKDEEENQVVLSDAYLSGLPQFILDSYGIQVDEEISSGTVSEEARDAVADTNVPEPQNAEEQVVTGNNQTSNGLTNEEIDWGE